MDSVNRKNVNSRKSRLGLTFAKVLHIRAATGISPVDEIQKIKSNHRAKKQPVCSSQSQEDVREGKNRVEEVLLAKLFASISSIKASYAQLQFAQSPYDPDGIQFADEMVVSELKNLSELKQCYLKKQLDFDSPESALVSAEIQEQKSLLKTYEITGKKLDSLLKLKDSELTFLKEKLEESIAQNRLIEKKLNSSGNLSVLDNLHLSGLNPSHLNTVLRHAIKSMRSFVRLMINEMESAGWDFDAAAGSIELGVSYLQENHKCFVFESFVSREMFEGFNYPNFALPNESLPDLKKRQRVFFERFTELKSVNPKEYLIRNSKSTFAKFCRAKYLRLVHPKMESSFFGNLSQRNLVSSGEFPETNFFAAFGEMAKRVWLLHCLAFSFRTEASIFQVRKGCRFSEVFMESVVEEPLLSSDVSQETKPLVAFTVIPGFKIGKTVIQCQVYLSQSKPPNNY